MMRNNIDHLYVHVPFCSSICYYCDFCHRIYDENVADKYLDRVDEDLSKYKDHLFKTVYIGGGTPTSLNDVQFKRLLDILKPFISSSIECTIEANPENLSDHKIALLKEYGINRISIGLQSADAKLLELMNRKHSFEDVKEIVKKLRDAGIDNISIDLMYSLPSQTMELLNDSLDKVLDLDVPHISIYSLTIEENSVFGKRGYKSLDADLEADMYEHIIAKLKNYGYRHYEISNFAKDGKLSKHNLGYWDYDDFLGIGPGSSSKIGNVRYTTTRNIKNYLDKVDLYDEYLELDVDDLKFENIMMSLRTDSGLDVNEFNNRYHCDFLKDFKKEMEMDDLLKVKGGRVVCTNINILNDVLLRFLND